MALDDICDRGFINSTVFLLGRNNHDIELIKSENHSDLKYTNDNQVKYRKAPGLKISFLTTHKSKGLEADNVIIINMQNKLLGFPNKIADDPLLQLVLSTNDTFPYAEERRLMYVALTRARNHVYLMTPVDNASEFIAELKPFCLKTNTGNDTLTINNPTCPKCQTGKLIIRKNDNNGKSFVGCSHFPVCNFSNNELSIISKPIRCHMCGGYLVERKGRYGTFYGCSNFPNCDYTLKS